MKFVQKLDTAQKVEALNAMKGGEVCEVTTLTTKEALKRSNAPANLAEIHTIRDMLMRVGGKDAYQSGVNDRKLEEGQAADFKSKGTYNEPISENGIVRRYTGKNPELAGQLYVRTFPNDCKKVGDERYFDADWNPLTEAQAKDAFEKYYAKKSPNKSQGLKDPLAVNDVRIENVLRVKRSESGFDATPGLVGVILSAPAPSGDDAEAV